MKKILNLVLLLVSVISVQAQQTLPREDLVKVTAILNLDLKQLLATPIPTDPDLKRPVAMREGPYGFLVLPESKLSAEAIARAGKEAVPVGQLWLRQVAPESNGKRIEADKLKTVTVGAGDRSEPAVLCALAVRKGAGDKLELLVYGKDKEPVLQAPLKSISVAQENPIELDGVVQGDKAVVTLKLAGKFEATFSLVRD